MDADRDFEWAEEAVGFVANEMAGSGEKMAGRPSERRRAVK